MFGYSPQGHREPDRPAAPEHTHTSERNQSEKAAHHESTYTTFWTEQSYGDSRETHVCRVIGKKGKILQNTFKKGKPNQ